MLKLSKYKKNYLKEINFNNFYSFDNAIKIIKKFSRNKFDESIDLSIKLKINLNKQDQVINDKIIFPYNIKRKRKIAVLINKKKISNIKKYKIDYIGIDNLLKQIKLKKIKFDLIIATNKTIKYLIPFSKILGPKKLMPNLKSGTLTNNIKKTLKNINLGQIQYKSDKFGIINIPIGRLSLKNLEIKTNFLNLIKHLNNNKPLTIKGKYLNKIFISSTMGFSLKIDISKI